MGSRGLCGEFLEFNLWIRENGKIGKIVSANAMEIIVGFAKNQCFFQDQIPIRNFVQLTIFFPKDLVDLTELKI